MTKRRVMKHSTFPGYLRKMALGAPCSCAEPVNSQQAVNIPALQDAGGYVRLTRKHAYGVALKDALLPKPRPGCSHGAGFLTGIKESSGM